LHGGNVFHSISFYFGFLTTILVIVRLGALFTSHPSYHNCLVHNSLQVLYYFSRLSVLGFDFTLLLTFTYTQAICFCLEMCCVYSTAENDETAKFEEWFSLRCFTYQENLCTQIMQRLIYTDQLEVTTLAHICQVFCWISSMMFCIPCLVRVSSFIQLVLLLTYFEYVTQFCHTSLVLNFFPTILSLISYSVFCKLFEPWMELNGYFY
jgi:hypothetical protein